jgi:hypothetical protein
MMMMMMMMRRRRRRRRMRMMMMMNVDLKPRESTYLDKGGRRENVCMQVRRCIECRSG